MDLSRRRIVLVRTACVLATAVALFLVLHRVDPREMLAVLRTMRPGWFVAAIALYGFLFVPAAWRWHLALRLAGNAVSFAITLRVALIGHFFYTILFGAVGGDTARSALYARQQKLPMTEILAASSLDRLMGCAGLIGFVSLAFGIAAAHHAADQIHAAGTLPSRGWLVALGVIIVAVMAVLSRSSAESPVKRFLRAFSQSGRLLIRSPRRLGMGILCGFAVQGALSGVLALNLEAVSHQPLPWLRLLWTFPLISVASSVPITVAGMGTRDSAALALLGLYGVAGPDAVAASLLTAASGLFWTAVGGLLLWREMRLNRKESDVEPMEGARTEASA
jgi:uncharacterized membrane protein YbhN (UPF0104 family)